MDITEHRLAEDKLRREEQIFRIITDQSSDMIILMDLEGRILYINPVVEKLLGFKPGEAIGIKGFENIHPEDMPFFKEQFYLLTKNRDAHVLQGEIRLRHRNGSYRTFELLGSNIGDNDFIEAVIVSCRDITERKKSEEALRQSEERYRTILEGIQEGYFEVDLAGNFTFFNDPLCEIIGYPREELVGLNYKVYTKKEMAKKVFQAFNKVYITETPTKEIDWQIIRKDGTERYIETSVTLRKDIAGKIIGFRGIIHDITEREQMHQQLNYMATHDALTGLPNRTLFLDRLQVALAQSRRNHSKVAVMMLDLDHFKDINDTFGHLVGDMLLQEVGRRLTGILRHNDTVARLGGDEFIILLSDLEKKEYAAGVAKVILKALQKPFHLGNRQIASHSSIGIALFPDDGSDTESLLKKSDIAMYSVKAHGRNNYRFFAEEM
jgi:diguanylate cyclase (GGDEF)-like protein/PAS domain S-box-containing protein